MWSRVRNPRCKNYKHYGARGITACERWSRFLSFLEDMGEKPKNGRYTLERIDNNGNYEPGNCKWATSYEQRRNQRNVRLIDIGGISLTIADWALKTGNHPKRIAERIERGWSIEKSIFYPKMNFGPGSIKKSSEFGVNGK